MKKITALLLALATLLALTACGGGGKSADPAGSPEGGQESSPAPEAESQAQLYQFGQSITSPSGKFVFTPVFEGFAASLSNVRGEHYLLPEGDGLDDANNPYKAEEGKVMMYYSATVEYVGDSKENETFSYTFRVDYDDGYTFEHAVDSCYYGEDPTSWDLGPTFEPLGGDAVRHTRFCVEVPDILEQDTDKQTLTIFTIEGEDFPFLTDTKAAAAAKADREAAEAAQWAEKIAPADETRAAAVKEKLQGSWEWSDSHYVTVGNKSVLDTTDYELVFQGDSFTGSLTMSLTGGSLPFSGTYTVGNDYLILNFSNSDKPMYFPYTYENGELSLDSDFVGKFPLS